MAKSKKKKKPPTPSTSDASELSGAEDLSGSDTEDNYHSASPVSIPKKAAKLSTARKVLQPPVETSSNTASTSHEGSTPQGGKQQTLESIPLPSNITETLNQIRGELEAIIADETYKISAKAARALRANAEKLHKVALGEALRSASLQTVLKLGNKPTYATVAATLLKQQTPAAQAPTRPLLVYPTKENTSSEELKKEILKKINPVSLKVKIHSIKKINNNGLLFSCAQGEDAHRLQAHIEKRIPQASCREPKKLKPRVILHNISDEYTEENLVPALIEHNELEISSDTLKPLFPIKGKLSNSWVLECEPQTYQILLTREKLFLGWMRIPIKNFIRVTRCLACYEFGHTKRFCKNTAACCSLCAGEHKHTECHSDVRECIACQRANTRFGLRLNTHHSAMDPQCPSYKRQLALLQSKIDYGS